MMGGGRPPPLSTVVSACAACSDLPASSAFRAASMAACASAGSCRFFFAGFLAPASPSSASRIGFLGRAPSVGRLGGGRGRCLGLDVRDASEGHGRCGRCRQSEPTPVARHHVFPRLTSRRTRSTSRTISYAISLGLGKCTVRVHGLFHSNRFGKVARLVHVGAHEHRRVVGDELHRHCVEQRADERVHRRQPDMRLQSTTGPLAPAHPTEARSCRRAPPPPACWRRSSRTARRPAPRRSPARSRRSGRWGRA